TMTWGGSGSPSTLSLDPDVIQGLSALVPGTPRATFTDALGHKDRWQLDTRGRPTEHLAADGGESTWARDGNGRGTGATDPLGRATTYTLDAKGYVTQESYADGTSRSYAFQSSFHALTTMTDERGSTSTMAYDGSGHLTNATDRLGKHTAYTYSSGLVRT